ncbi:MAG: peptidylprolyl isomerase [Flavobacteriaceae bacterium]|nr:peptidylprolyl isomerase [Flavobacteriaceae bacterium]
MLWLGLAFVSYQANAQLQKGQLIDGVAAVVGNEIILESDIVEQANYAKQQGMTSTDKCEFVEGLLNNKLMIYHAKKDTLIPNRSKEIKAQVNQKYEQILSQFPSEKEMLEAYKFKSAVDMKNTIEQIDSDTYYGQSKYARITEKTDITPNEVTDFYNAYKFQLPEVKDEVILSQIVMYPKLTEAHKGEIINKLKRIKQDILNGESFELQARIYSEDEGSASNGGLYQNIPKGRMVKAFEATALNLQEGEISDPIETEYGYHIIQLVKKKGKIYDARHILIKTTPNAEEIAMAKKELQDIKQQILDGKITFKEAAYRYSDDKNTKFNAGILVGSNGSTKIEKTELPANIAYQIAGYNQGDITEIFEDELNRRKGVALLRIEESIPAHQLSLETDYDRVKVLALNNKKNQIVEKWIKEQLPETFISIDKRYNHCAFKTKWIKK